MEESSSDEEYCQVQFWNNWQSSSIQSIDRIPGKSLGNFVKKARDIRHNSPKTLTCNFVGENSTFKNWIPPTNFLNSSSEIINILLPQTNGKHFPMLTVIKNVSDKHDLRKNIEKGLEVVKEDFSFNTDWSRVNIFHWGNRIQLHDITKLNEGDFIWGVVNLAIFSNIKLWVNEYGIICCSAQGEISKLGSPEVTHISITSTQHLRKMLNISAAQWAVLCESVQETKIILNFNAFQDFEIAGKTALERLWFFICKRRHFFPRQRILVKFCGAVKCIRKFNIIPKLLVQDIMDVLGERIL